MEVYAHHKLKENNQFLLLHSLYKNKDMTMFDLVNDTHLSQSSVRNMLKEFERLNIVEKSGMKESTGGRCPARYALVPQSFTIGCFYIHKNDVDYHIIQGHETITKGQLMYQSYEEVFDLIKVLQNTYTLRCLVFAVEGIVYGYRYYIDHENRYIENDWIERLQHFIHIPIFVENDVKLMQKGMYAQDDTLKDFAFLYVNHLGMACSSMTQGKIMQGHKGIMGELGLLSYEDMTINHAIRICPSTESFQKIIVHLLSIICVSIDPEKILVTSQLPFSLSSDVVRDELQHIVHQEYEVIFIKDTEQFLWKGMGFLGMMKLLKTAAGDKNEIL